MKKRKKDGRTTRRSAAATAQRLRDAATLAEQGRYDDARAIYEELLHSTRNSALVAKLHNNLAVLAAMVGDLDLARIGFSQALKLDPRYEPALKNAACMGEPVVASGRETAIAAPEVGAVKVAIASFLFNWPSTGGGIVHTLELARFLKRAGYVVEHFYARYEPWGIGCVTEELGFPTHALAFDSQNWNVAAIQGRYARVIEPLDPDYVIITDAWNFKPLLAQALSRWPYLLRFQALECLCPLNNVRLLLDADGRVEQCPKHQLATPEECWRCVASRGRLSGSLHQAERALAGVGTPDYDRVLRQALQGARAVLVVNPLMEAMLAPYAQRVVVAPSGMDPARFPWPRPTEPADPDSTGKTIVFFAGLVAEPMKGYAVLDEACRQLWQRRQDFELVATGDPAGRVNAYSRFIGWQSQLQLPQRLRAADILAFPTIAQEALGRTAVEAMACGRPVVASRLGGLAYTVADGATGLLCEPGDPADLARKIETLLDDPDLRSRLGEAGRKRFEEHYSWNVVIERHYRPLLARPTPSYATPKTGAYEPRIPERVDHDRLIRDVGEFVGLSHGESRRLYDEYFKLHVRQNYAQRFGEYKTLCHEEAFVLYAIFSVHRPETIVEIGTQTGRATRRILDMKSALGLSSRVVTFDLVDAVEHFDRSEAEVLVMDVTGQVRRGVFERFRPDVIFLDAHPYALLKELVVESIAHPAACMLAIHDCGPGLCNPRMTLAKDDPNVTSLTGIWERHVLAEVFSVAGPLSSQLDDLSTPTHRLKVFATPHGLGVIAPNGQSSGARPVGP